MPDLGVPRHGPRGLGRAEARVDDAALRAADPPNRRHAGREHRLEAIHHRIVQKPLMLTARMPVPSSCTVKNPLSSIRTS